MHPHLDVRSLRQQTSGMECPICLEGYSPENAARGPRESAPTICEHMACNGCWARVAQGPGPYRCAMCRAGSTRWVLRNFETPAPAPPDEAVPRDEDEESTYHAFRREVADRLRLRFPDMDVDWLAGLLEVLAEDPTIRLRALLRGRGH